jgi:hypothetical protein
VGTASEMPAIANFPWRTARLVISIKAQAISFWTTSP